VISAVFGTWQDQPRCGCGRAERSRWQDQHVRTENARSPNFVCAAVARCRGRDYIVHRWGGRCRLTGQFPSNTPGCDRNGWRGRGSTAWTLFCSWPAANAAGSGSTWHGRSDSSGTRKQKLRNFSSQHSLFIFGHTRSPIHIIFFTNNRSFLPVSFPSSLESTPGSPPSTTH